MIVQFIITIYSLNEIISNTQLNKEIINSPVKLGFSHLQRSI